MRKNILNISSRGELVPFSPMRKFVPFLEKAKERGIEVFELQIGQPDFPTPKEILRNLNEFKLPRLSYTHFLGPLELREGWRKYFQNQGIDFEISDIVCTLGASEAILFAFAAICDPGENIILFEPFYPNYLGFAYLLGIKLKAVRLKAENGYHLPKEKEIEKLIDKKTKGILITNPNNPTGTVYEKKELEMVWKIAKKHNLFILSDETYREFVYDGREFFSMANFNGERVIILESASKKLSSCGARIGCLASKNKKVIETTAKFAQTRLSLPQAEALAVASVLKHSKSYTRKIVKECKKRRDVVFNELKKIPGVFCLKPEGAFYILVKLPIKDSDDFAKWLLTDFSYKGKTVMVTPGSGFYLTPGLGKDEIRIAFVLSPKKLKEAISILGIALKEYSHHGN